MKVLTVLEPWASLIIHGHKRWEHRSWPTAHRGPLAIHAGRRFGPWQRLLCEQMPIERVLSAAGIRRPSDLPFGCILGAVTVIDCVPASELEDGPPLVDSGFAWRLADPVRLPIPVPHRGQLGLCELPPEIAKILEELLYTAARPTLVGSLT
jgi:hypothetical protein